MPATQGWRTPRTGATGWTPGRRSPPIFGAMRARCGAGRRLACRSAATATSHAPRSSLSGPNSILWWKQDGLAAVNRPEEPERASSERPAGLTRLRAGVLSGMAIAALTAMAMLAARFIVFGSSVSSPAISVRPSPFTSLEGEVGYPAFAPDGKHLAFTWANPEAPNSSIYLKAIGGDAPIRLTYPKDGGDAAPKWSPDGHQIAFLRFSETEAGIFAVPELGGPVRRLLELRPDRYYDLDYSPDGKTIAFAQRVSTRDPYCISLLSLADGTLRQLTFPPTGSFGEVKFAFSPDGSALAFLRHETEPALISLQVVTLGRPSSSRTLAEYAEWIGELTWSADSESVILAGNRQGVRTLWRVLLKNGTNGGEREIAGVGTDVYFPAVSKSGSQLAFVHEVQDSDLWRAELLSPEGPGKAPLRVISSKRVEGAPRFSPDGKRIAFQSYRSGVPEIWASDPDGSNAVQITDLRTVKPEMPAWSPDGNSIAIADGGGHVINAAGGQPRRLFADTGPFEGPSWSRDGQRIYFWRKDPGGDAQIWQVRSGGGVTSQLTKSGGLSSMESPDGEFLYSPSFASGESGRCRSAAARKRWCWRRCNLNFPGTGPWSKAAFIS